VSEIEGALTALRTQLSFLHASSISPEDVRRSLSALRRLAEAAETSCPIRQKATGLNPEEVWEKWRAESFLPGALSRREWRTLCGSPETALRAELVACLLQHTEPLSRLANLIGIAQAYFRYWRPEKEGWARPSTIERLILRELDRTFEGSKNRVILAWRLNPQLFSAAASDRLADTVVHDLSSIAVAAGRVFVEASSGLATQSLEIAAMRGTRRLLELRADAQQSMAMGQFLWLREKVFVPELGADTYRKTIGELIMSSLPDRYPEIRRLMVETISEDPRLGDPRLAENGPKWRSLAGDPQQVFLSWLAERYIHLFFNLVVPASDENRRRAEFWLRYAKRRGNIRDFQVAVSAEDIHRVHRREEVRGLSYDRVSAAANASSAFLMEFHAHGERYIMVEFSETGNAACIYTRDNFESSGASLRRSSYSMTELRNTKTRSDSIWHIGGWEHTAELKLRRLGINP
jgi:hypothetical protein